ncbi:MAG: hypothetical protein KDE51_14895 [Anaerolineales bacterium]|nr:hypothetical protein [Anaerolineales bacterium]
MVELEKLTKQIIGQMPPTTRFRQEDVKVIGAHKDFLLSLEDKIVAGFYDTLFNHAPTKAIFVEGERPDREQTLRNWWQRTLNGPFDASYWTWQTLVGLIHIKRKVKNPMMIAMWGWVLNTLRSELSQHCSAEEVTKVMDSFERLAATIQALTAESYLENYINALSTATGFNMELLQRMVNTEVEDLIKATGR